MTYTQVTLADLQADLSAMVDDSPYWTAAEATTAINEALRTWNLMTGHWKVRALFPTEQFVHWYYIPAGVFYPYRFTYHTYPLYKTNWFDLDYGKDGWEGQASSDTGAPPRPSLWAPMGLNQFCISPSDSQASPSNMTLDSVAIAPQLSSASDYIDIGREEQGAILSYSLHKLSFKEGGPRFQASIQHYRRFVYLAGVRNSRLRAGTFYKKLMVGFDLSVEDKMLGNYLDRGKQPQGQPQ